MIIFYVTAVLVCQTMDNWILDNRNIHVTPQMSSLYKNENNALDLYNEMLQRVPPKNCHYEQIIFHREKLK